MAQICKCILMKLIYLDLEAFSLTGALWISIFPARLVTLLPCWSDSTAQLEGHRPAWGFSNVSPSVVCAVLCVVEHIKDQ